jgi:hypothetical protein
MNAMISIDAPDGEGLRIIVDLTDDQQKELDAFTAEHPEGRRVDLWLQQVVPAVVQEVFRLTPKKGTL